MILDTSGLSAMADGDMQLEPLLQRALEIAIPAIVLGEYRYSIRQSRHQRRYELWLADVLSSCRVLVVDEGTASQYAEVRDELKRMGRPIPANDLGLRPWRGSMSCR